MNNQQIFSFITDISTTPIPEKLNNPFGSEIPKIARIAANEFQEFITIISKEWGHDFQVERGKMFGILVVQKQDTSFAYLGTVSGKLLGNSTCNNFVPSVFNVATDDYFFRKGMMGLTEISNQIKSSNNKTEIQELREKRKLKSHGLQQRLFEHTKFLNNLGTEKNVLQIFEQSPHGLPPSAAGECAAPKLLNFAFQHQLKPIALAEFWWGNSSKNKERAHKVFYPACRNKCRPILEYMLGDAGLFESANDNTLR